MAGGFSRPQIGGFSSDFADFLFSEGEKGLVKLNLDVIEVTTEGASVVTGAARTDLFEGVIAWRMGV